jgi:hypothetical protein
MKTIITENQNNKLQTKLKDLVKDYGWEAASKAIGGTNKLAKIAFNNNPMDFLHLFDGLDVVQSKEKPDLTLFRYKPNHNLMVYDRENGVVYVSYDDIWSFLKSNFGFNYSEIQELIKEWLDEVYNLRGVTPKVIFSELLSYCWMRSTI